MSTTSILSESYSSASPVLVVGAGPSGLAMALALLRNGIPVRIIEKDTKYHVGSRGAGIHLRTLEIYKFLGIVDDVLEQAVGLAPLRAYKMPEGREVIRTWNLFDDFGGTPDIPMRFPTGLGQQYAEAIFRSHIERYGCRVELGKELIGIDQDDAGVTAQIRLHPEGAIETFRASYVVGADGAKGAVRKLLGLNFLGETRDAEATMVGDVQITNLDADHWHLWTDPEIATVALRPTVPGDTTAPFQFVINGHSFDPMTLLQPEALVKFLYEFTKRTELQFGEFTWISNFRPNVRVVDRFRVGRAFIVGDAAHVHPPTGGQGLNSSVQDSFNLAWKLALAYKGLAQPDLLDTYNDERLPVIAEMLRQTGGLYVNAFGKDRKDRTLLPFSEWNKNKALLMLGINYRWSKIVLDERRPSELDEDTLKAHSYGGYDSALGAGDRAPEAPNLCSLDSGKDTTLFNIFNSTRHTILIFVTDSTYGVASDIIKATNSLPKDSFHSVILTSTERNDLDLPKADIALFDSKGYARKHYNVDLEDSITFIIRPDGYIGGICKSADGLKQYFNGILRCIM